MVPSPTVAPVSFAGSVHRQSPVATFARVRKMGLGRVPQDERLSFVAQDADFHFLRKNIKSLFGLASYQLVQPAFGLVVDVRPWLAALSQRSLPE